MAAIGPTNGSDAPSPGDGAVKERLAKVEGEVAGVGRVQTVTTWALGLIGTLVVAVMVGGFAVLAGTMSWRFGAVERDLERLRVEQAARFDALAAKVDAILTPAGVPPPPSAGVGTPSVVAPPGPAAPPG